MNSYLAGLKFDKTMFNQSAFNQISSADEVCTVVIVMDQLTSPDLTLSEAQHVTFGIKLNKS